MRKIQRLSNTRVEITITTDQLAWLDKALNKILAEKWYGGLVLNIELLTLTGKLEFSSKEICDIFMRLFYVISFNDNTSGQ